MKNVCELGCPSGGQQKRRLILLGALDHDDVAPTFNRAIRLVGPAHIDGVLVSHAATLPSRHSGYRSPSVISPAACNI